jgi:hypothetical protein
MFVRLKLLRRDGERLPPHEVTELHYEAGQLVMVREHGQGRFLRYQRAACAPGIGELARLYRPEVVDMDGDAMVIRGIERVSTARGARGVVQEWMLTPAPSGSLYANAFPRNAPASRSAAPGLAVPG